MQILSRIELPDGVSPETGVACYDQSGGDVAFRVVSREERELWLLVNVGPAPSSFYHVYFGAKDLPGKNVADLVDPVPIGVSVFRSGAQGIPNTWEKMQFMVGKGSAPIASFRQHHVGSVDLAGRIDTGRHSHSRRPNPGRLPIVKLDTRFRCAKSGSYRFAVDSRDVAYVLVDGALVASRESEGLNGDWHAGESVHLGEGVHRLEVYHKTKSRAYVRVGWETPGREGIRAIPHAQFLSSCMVQEARLDHRDDSAYPDLSFRIRRAYTFRDCPAVFVPVQFTASASGVSGDVEYSWDFGDGNRGTGSSLTHIYKATDLYDVTLSVRQGASPVRTVEAIVDCRLVRTAHHVFSPQVIGLPAVCYATDNVEPILLIEGKPIGQIALDVAWTVDGEGGQARDQTTVTLGQHATRLPILSRKAADVASIEWSISHLGVRLCSETVTFQRPPFRQLPVDAHGERLHAADGTRIVLVPFRYADEYSQPPVGMEQAFGTLACIDDSLAVSGTYGDFYETTYYRRLGKLLNGPERPIVNHLPLRGWCEVSEVYGPLLRLLDAPSAAEGADAIVLSVGLPDVSWDCSPDEFERHVAALVDLLSATTGCPVVMATPPPFRNTGSEVRLYAAAIQRVAQARDIPVADLYSAFMSAGEERDGLFVDKSDFVLSSRGHHLVARVMARAMLMQAGEER